LGVLGLFDARDLVLAVGFGFDGLSMRAWLEFCVEERAAHFAALEL
jgi:hypothetical protein